MKDTSKKNDSCNELKNIKYQNMLLSNSKLKNDAVSNIYNIDNFLKQEIQLNKKLPWNKLGKSRKIVLIKKYIIKYSNKHKLSDKLKQKLQAYLLLCIDRKKLQKIKDLQYDIEKNEIVDIPLLHFNKSNEKFILKRSDKKHKISSHLAPKKNKKTLKQLREEKEIKSNKTTKNKVIKKKDKKEKKKKEKVKKDKMEKKKVKKDKDKKDKMEKKKVKKEKDKKDKMEKDKKDKKDKDKKDKMEKDKKDKDKKDKMEKEKAKKEKKEK